ncbi:MAG: amidohydrolase family protein [Pseudomonadales bacterium]|nr:amidohydrolase family protein [Pseudomonadales bacterium]
MKRLLLTILFLTAPTVAMTAEMLIENARVFDGRQVLPDVHAVLVVGDKIAAMGPDAINEFTSGTRIDAAGAYLLPGLIDMHTHLMFSPGLVASRDSWDSFVLGGVATQHMQEMFLQRGFTSVRDIGGASTGLSRAVRAGLLEGPRIWSAGAALSGTSGHADADVLTQASGTKGKMHTDGQLATVDGRAEVLNAVRTNFRRGAAFIKVMASGGVATELDPLESLGFTVAEMEAAVEAASDYGSYVAAHAYDDAAVNRALDAGVKSIEHGFLMSEKTVKRMAKEGAYFSWQAFASIVLFADVDSVPNFSEVSKAKARKIYANAEKVLGWLRKYDVKVVGGSDLFSMPIIERVLDDVAVKQKYFSPIESLRMHTSTAGELLALSGPKNPYIEAPVGVLEPGAWADLLLVRGELLDDLDVLLDVDNVRLIVKNGQVYKSL